MPPIRGRLQRLNAGRTAPRQWWRGRASQLPGWFQTVHDWLPVRPAADLLRSGLASQTYVASTRDLVVLLVWTTVGLAITLRALTRRA